MMKKSRYRIRTYFRFVFKRTIIEEVAPGYKKRYRIGTTVPGCYRVSGSNKDHILRENTFCDVIGHGVYVYFKPTRDFDIIEITEHIKITQHKYNR